MAAGLDYTPNKNFHKFQSRPVHLESVRIQTGKFLNFDLS